MSGRPDVPGRDASPQDSMLEPRQDGLPPQAADRRRAAALRRPAPDVPPRRGPDRPPGEGPPRPGARRPRVGRRRRRAPRRPAPPARPDRRRPPGRRHRRRDRATGGSRPSTVDEDPADAEALAGWLDANAPRSRARRAAAAPRADLADRRRRDPRRGCRRGRPERVGRAHRTTRHPTGRLATTRCCRSRPPATSRSGSSSPVPPTPRGSPSACRRPWPATPASPSPSSRTSSPHERELATLRARDAERSTFVSTVAHELRTPLTGLRGYLELILGGQVARPGGRARLPRAEPVDRRLDGATSSATCWSCRAWSRGRSTSRSDRSRSPRPAPRSRRASCRSRSTTGSRLTTAAAAADAGRDRRPAAGRADPDEPRRRTP